MHTSSLPITKTMEMPGIEPGASHMRSMRSSTELHPLLNYIEMTLKKIWENIVNMAKALQTQVKILLIDYHND